MARIRTIKPDFFRHEALYDAETASSLPLRLAFAGLWTACDREGRFKWAPRALKLDCLPFDDCDFVDVLDALVSFGFVVKYQVGTEIFGHIPSWLKHQHVNQREAESAIPAPDDAGARTCETIPAHGEGKGREQEGKGKEHIHVADATARSVFPTDLDLTIAFDHWNDTATTFGLAAVKDRGSERRQKLKQRLLEAGSLAQWCLLINSLQDRPFCLGEGPRNGQAPWKVDIDYLLTKQGFRKLLEGAWLRDGAVMGEVELEGDSHAGH